MTARRLLVRLSIQVRQLGEHRQPRIVTAAQRAIGKTIAAQLAKLQATIAAQIQADAEFAARAAVIQSIPGLGPQFVAGALAWLPELGHITNKAAAALVGIAPYHDDSGEHRGERHIRGGRRDIRDLLYIATLGAASRHNPVVQAYYHKPTINGCAPRARRPRSRLSPACAS